MATRIVMRSRLGKIAREADDRAVGVVDKTSADIEAGCKRRSRVDTGQMMNGWVTDILGKLRRRVGNSVEHVIYNEFGAQGMSPQPMLGPSVEAAREPFGRAIAEIYQ